MNFEPRIILLKDGRNCVLRPTHPDDSEQMELEVACGNERAIHLYKKCGFCETGRHLRALKYDDGTYRDELIMNKVL